MSNPSRGMVLDIHECFSTLVRAVPPLGVVGAGAGMGVSPLPRGRWGGLDVQFFEQSFRTVAHDPIDGLSGEQVTPMH